MHVTARVTVDSALAATLHARAEAARWHVSVEVFSRALEASARHAFSGKVPAADEVERYVESLHLSDLALACACAEGDDAAWEHFVREFRPAIYRAAEAIDRAGGARELADSLYADLFGLRAQDGERRSLFRYFHGRSGLGSWVRAVLSQRYVDRVRVERRFDPLPEEDAPDALAGPSRDVDPDRATFLHAMQAALAAALAALAPRDRLRLGCYYIQALKLAAIGRLLAEHEATVSRHLTRTRREIRAAVERHLRERQGYDEAAIAECFQAAADDGGVFDLASLMAESSPGKKAASDRSKD